MEGQILLCAAGQPLPVMEVVALDRLSWPGGLCPPPVRSSAGGLLRCGRAALEKLPSGCVIFTRQNAFGCESLIRDRLTVQRLLPEAVIDPAGIDDIMRFYSGRDAQ